MSYSYPQAGFLQVDGVQVSYGERHALRGVSLQVARGQVVGLLGHNGAGKTTLMLAVAGLVRLARGRIRVGDVDVARDSRAARRLIGIAPQDLAVFPPLTVVENIRGWAELAGLRGRQCRRAIRDAIGVMQLDHVYDRQVQRLSGGEQRRVHCAMAIVARPPLLLLDEPTVGVDPATRRAVLTHVAALAAQGAAVLYSTHYLAEIEQLGADVIILHHGQVLASGGVANLVSQLSGTTVELAFHRPEGGPPRTVRVPVTDPVGELPAILHSLGERQRLLAGVSIQRPSLEDAFFRLTGGALNGAPNGDLNGAPNGDAVGDPNGDAVGARHRMAGG